MKLRINGLENEINFNENNINVLVIEDNKFYARIIELLNNKIKGSEDVELLLLDDETELKMSNKAFMLIDLYNIDYNSKRILNKIYAILEENINKENDIGFQRNVMEIRNYLITEINELPLEFTISTDFDTKDMFKLFDLKLDELEYSTVLERTELMIDIIKILNIADLLIVPNLRLFLNQEEIKELYKYVMYNDIKLLTVENSFKNKYDMETIYYVDENFDEVVYI